MKRKQITERENQVDVHLAWKVETNSPSRTNFHQASTSDSSVSCFHPEETTCLSKLSYKYLYIKLDLYIWILKVIYLCTFVTHRPVIFITLASNVEIFCLWIMCQLKVFIPVLKGNTIIQKTEWESYLDIYSTIIQASCLIYILNFQNMIAHVNLGLNSVV